MTDDGSSADEVRVATRGPRHAAPRRQLRSRLQLPAGKVLAIAAVPTALLMGAGYTPTLAMADDSSPKDMAKACATATDTPLKETTPSASADSGKQPAASDTPSAKPSQSASTPAAGQTGKPADGATPADSATPSADASAPATGAADAGGTTGQSVTEKLSQAAKVPAASPSPSTTAAGNARGQGLLGGLLGGVGGLLTGGGSSGGASATPSPSASSATPTPSASSSSAAPTPSASAPKGGGKGSAGGGALDPVGKATAAVSDAEKAVTSVAGGLKNTKDSVAKAAGEAVTSVTSPSPSSSQSPGPDALCATDASAVKAKSEAGTQAIPDQPWTLKSSRLALHGVVFGGVVDITTHSGATKRVLKFTADSIDIGDLDMSTIEYNKKTTHVKGRAGSTSTMVKGPIVMYTESLTGTLSKVEGLPIPALGAITLTPDTLPKFLFDLIGSVPIKLELEFTDAKAVQAGQFGGTLNIPGMHLYTDDEPYDG
ncbi:hypothetical protein [Peterkaempfera sp. SMS 1(5)a]|uniref:hypothetical protein n=1 Tax=Peterkaempfera podocarpi TaxID=3232308 RepID=UPI00366E0896